MPSHANPVNWFEIPVTDMERAKKFYQAVFAVEITDSEMGPTKWVGFPWKWVPPDQQARSSKAMATHLCTMDRSFTSTSMQSM